MLFGKKPKQYDTFKISDVYSEFSNKQYPRKVLKNPMHKVGYCRKCSMRLISFDEENGKIYNGIFYMSNEKNTRGVLAIKPRHDNEIGIQCSCGNQNMDEGSRTLAETLDLKEQK